MKAPLFALLALISTAVAQTQDDDPNPPVDDDQVDAFVEKYLDVICAVCIGLGLIVAFYGYKLLKPTIFLFASFAAGSFCYYLTSEAAEDESYQYEASVAASVVGGLIGGFLAVKLLVAGVFLLGAGGGVLLTLFIRTSIYPSCEDLYAYIAAAIVALICGFLALKIERTAIILITAFSGAIGAVQAAGYFIGDYPDPTDMSNTLDEVKETHEVDLPTAWWYYFAATVALAVIATFVQFKHTAPPALNDDEEDEQEQYRRYEQPSRGPQRYTKANVVNGSINYV